MKEEWLLDNAVVPVDVETTSTLVAEIRRLIGVVGGMALAQPVQQEPVACQYAKDVAMPEYRCVGRCQYDTSPPAQPAQRKPLTDEQIDREWQFLHDEEGNPPDHHDFARAIEAAHGVKENT